MATATVTVDGKIQRPPVIDYRLEDVPELGYFTTDKPYPRGEFLVKIPKFMAGYYKRPDLTAEKFTEDGFYKSGDVMALIGPDELAYVDRTNNVQKLSQGEFVAIARLEALYTQSPAIRQIYVYGTSERAFLLAVVVPADELLADFAKGGEASRAGQGGDPPRLAAGRRGARPCELRDPARFPDRARRASARKTACLRASASSAGPISRTASERGWKPALPKSRRNRSTNCARCGWAAPIVR
ncbi:MAG: AMP-binding protein [Novosphingobium sp.]